MAKKQEGKEEPPRKQIGVKLDVDLWREIRSWRWKRIVRQESCSRRPCGSTWRSTKE